MADSGPEHHCKRPPWWLGEFMMVTSIIGLATMIGYFAGETAVIRDLSVDHLSSMTVRAFWAGLMALSATYQGASVLADSTRHRQVSAGAACLLMFMLSMKMHEGGELPVLFAGTSSIAIWEAVYCWFLWGKPHKWESTSSQR